MDVSDTVVIAWARLLRAQAVALARVEGALKAQGLPPLAWYDVLLELERSGAPMRPHVLEGELLLAQYNLSRLLDRMEAAGLIARSPDPQDGRGRLVALTDAGRATRHAMWPVYAGAIQAAVGERLSEAQARSLADLLGKLA